MSRDARARSMRVCFFDCFSGAAGDMILGALLDAGAPEEEVRGALDALGIAGWELSIDEVTKGGLRAIKATVEVERDEDRRAYEDIVGIITSARLNQQVAERALKAFAVLGEAEARVHGVDLADIHFHEVGAIDAIVDVVGSCAALEALRPDLVVCSPLRTGTGSAETSHGSMPLPVPAVAEMARRARASIIAGGSRELTTPTGAALLISFADRFGVPPAMRLEACGYGAGALQLEQANVLRVLLGEATQTSAAARRALAIETNIDDMSTELFPHVIDMLIAAGAQDAWITPAVMKKGRPAHVLTVLASPEHGDRLTDIIYRETTTFGLRITEVLKEELDRTWIEVDVAGEPVRVKLAFRSGMPVTLSPEYEDARRAARATGLALKEVYALALRVAEDEARSLHERESG